jgi:hypothetical protein
MADQSLSFGKIALVRDSSRALAALAVHAHWRSRQALAHRVRPRRNYFLEI